MYGPRLRRRVVYTNQRQADVSLHRNRVSLTNDFQIVFTRLRPFDAPQDARSVFGLRAFESSLRIVGGKPSHPFRVWVGKLHLECWLRGRLTIDFDGKRFLVIIRRQRDVNANRSIEGTPFFRRRFERKAKFLIVALQ